MRMVPQVIDNCSRINAPPGGDPPGHFHQGMIFCVGIGKLFRVFTADVKLSVI
jgi:hypothetical protein